MLYLKVASRVLVLIAIVFGIPMLFSYLIYKNIKEKKSPLLGLLFALCLVGYIYCAAGMLSSVESCYVGKGLYKRNRIYFYTLFLNKLKETSDVRKSAVYMLQDKSIKEKVIHYRKFLILPYKITGACFLVCCGFFLFFSLASLFFLRYRDWKYYKISFFAAFISGCCLYAPGVYYSSFASSCNPELSAATVGMFNIMKELKEYKGSLRAEEIIALTEKYINDSNYIDRGTLYGFRLQEAEKDKKMQNEFLEQKDILQ